MVVDSQRRTICHSQLANQSHQHQNQIPAQINSISLSWWALSLEALHYAYPNRFLHYLAILLYPETPDNK